MQSKVMPKRVKTKVGKIREGSKKKTNVDSNILTLDVKSSCLLLDAIVEKEIQIITYP